MRSLLFALVVLFAAPSFAEARATLWPGASGFVLAEPLSGGGFSQLGVSYKLTRWIEPELTTGLGLSAGGNFDYLTRIAFGLRVNAPVLGERVVPFGWLAFSHFHEAPVEVLLENPVATVLGISETGVAHRSGAEGGLGVTFKIPTLPIDDAPLLEVSLRGTALWLPSFASVVEKGPQRGTHVYGVVEVLVGLPLDLSPLLGEL